nr:hypothetical protein CparaKRNrm1_p046 [Cryptomonas paramecium]
MKIEFRNQLVGLNFQQLFFFWFFLLTFSNKNYFQTSIKEKSVFFFFFSFFFCNFKALCNLNVKNIFFLPNKSFRKINKLLVLSSFKYFFLKYSNIELIDLISNYFFINSKLHIFKKIIFVNQVKNFQMCVKLKTDINEKFNFLHYFKRSTRKIIINLLSTSVYCQFVKYFFHVIPKLYFQRNDELKNLSSTLLHIRKNIFLTNLLEKKKNLVYITIYFKKAKRQKKNYNTIRKMIN